MRLITEDTLAVITILQEAAGESYEGKVAVAEVIRNRMNKRYASDGTVSDTVLRPKQFSGWNTSDPGRIRNIRADSESQIVQDCIRAWLAAREGSNTVHGAVLYFAPSTLRRLGIPDPEWALPDSADEVAIIGHHHFFIPKSRPGTVRI